MSRREREVRVRLEGLLSEGQLEIVSDIVFGQLMGSAGDLALLNKMRDPKRAVREVAALGRLSYWLEYREILVPDRIAREVMSRLAAEVDGMNEQGDTTGGDPKAEHDAMWAFVSLLSDWPVAAQVEEVFSIDPTPAESKGGGK
jgi:hypothetical protein